MNDDNKFENDIPSNDYDEMQRLLKKSTFKKKDDNLNEAIDLLEKAFKIGGEYMTIEECLRLPMYLQKAGRNDEGWQKLTKLLNEGKPNSDKYFINLERSIIYRKMSLFKKRLNFYDDALIYKLCSYFEELNQEKKNTKNTAIFVDRIKVLNYISSEKHYIAFLSAEIKKTKYKKKEDEIFKMLKLYISNLPINNINKTVSDLLNI